MQNSPKHEPIDSCLYLSRYISECMMRSDALNSHIDPVRTEITGIQQIHISHVFYLDDSKSKDIIVDEKLSHVCFTDKGKSGIVIVNKSST